VFIWFLLVSYRRSVIIKRYGINCDFVPFARCQHYSLSTLWIIFQIYLCIFAVFFSLVVYTSVMSEHVVLYANILFIYCII